MSITMKRMMWMGVLALLGFGLTRAATSRFREKEEAILKVCREQRASAAPAVRPPTPEIRMVSSACIKPGATGEVVLKGRFPQGTKFVFENDNLEVVKETVLENDYHATLRAAPDMGPQTATVTGITPTCRTIRQERAVTVTGKFEWTMNAANGWKIVARPKGNKACGGQDSSDEPYELSFYRQGEANPFEKRSATLYFSIYESTNYRFRISQDDPAMQGGVESMTALMQKLQDRSLTDAQRDKLMQQIEQAQAKMQADMQKMMDPAYIKAQEAKKLEFGCERIGLAVQGANFTGEMGCAQKVGTRIAITGTLRALAN
jgi:hypothetical protein